MVKGIGRTIESHEELAQQHRRPFERLHIASSFRHGKPGLVQKHVHQRHQRLDIVIGAPGPFVAQPYFSVEELTAEGADLARIRDPHSGGVGAAVEPECAGPVRQHAVAMTNVEAGPRPAFNPNRSLTVTVEVQGPATLLLLPARRNVDAKPPLLPTAMRSAETLSRFDRVQRLFSRCLEVDRRIVDRPTVNLDGLAVFPDQFACSGQQVTRPPGDKLLNRITLHGQKENPCAAEVLANSCVTGRRKLNGESRGLSPDSR